jgi:type IV secretory pathway TraG/TraD family ATPase VirD4
MARAGDFLKHFFFGLVILFSRISSFFQRSHMLHHARLATLHELSKFLTDRFDDTSLLLGISHFNTLLCVRPTQTRPELGNLLAIATTRGGKGLLATSQLLSWPHSVIVNDIKGDLYDQTAGYRRTLGKVVVIYPQGYGHRHDPFFGMHTEDALLSAATHLLFDPEERDKVFTQRAITMLTQLFLAARIEGYPPLPYVRHMIRSPLPDVAARLNILNPDLATQFLQVHFEPENFATKFFDNKFLVSAWETVTSRLKPLLTETVIRTLAGTDVTAQEIMCSKQPVTVYLRWPERDLLTLSPLVRLIWGSLIDGLTHTYDDAKGVHCKPVLLLIDEAGRTAIPALADNASTVAGRNISLWLSIQSLSQLDAVYGEARAQIIKDNMFTQLFYKPSDQKTAEYIERALGYKSGFAHSETKHETHSSEGASEQRIPVLTAWEIKHLTKRDEIFGFYNSDDELPPFRAKRMDWRRFPVLMGRQAIAPPELSVLPELAETLPILTPQSNGQLHDFINPDMTG